MNLLVTAGNTQTPIDDVRCITNIFSGRTGSQIAARAYERHHVVTLLTSHPEVLGGIPAHRPRSEPAWRVRTYRTFDDLETALREELAGRRYDALIHAAAVSDYRVAGVYTRRDGDTPEAPSGKRGKLKSHHPELWLKLVPTPKLVDKVRPEWGFTGVLVKFKLEVGLSEEQLSAVAETARVHSAADLMVANTLEGMHEWALVGAGEGGYRRVARPELPDVLLDAVESLGRQARLPK